MSTALGIVAEAAVDQMAASLAPMLPGLPEHELRTIARAQVEDLRTAGWRITAPVAAAATSRRRRTGATG